ncbi:hypothetical protein INR77_06015 [Erythrobacter sp. SCSIO 43205]|uniref:hypothetical protein n=1 Tax=Erythrobacter sp. SCSIO 43205 TaxID=2779361 RepID=UPI001CA920D3|nr:hypothetical protein [Erythrobacter sp. SCSIO 43205]UAB79233.1 hypothetical protein INR77_06015 [Erythrobacter sp. SCSIO 43205]
MIADLLENCGIRTVLIVDDGYDEAPRLADLGATNPDWATFFDDLTEDDEGAIAQAFPGFDLDDADDYSKDEAFLQVVWALKDEISDQATAHILETYEHDQQAMSRFLTEIEGVFAGYGLEVARAGRDFVPHSADADLILIDLFLGAQQADDDMSRSIAGLKEVLENRADSPPAIILMSSHRGIGQKRGRFRDEAGVFASGFRAISKDKLRDTPRRDQILLELARHRADSLKLSSFLQTWRVGMEQAVNATSADLRRLDLEDIAQLQSLLLDDEQEPRSSYMLDLVDRLLVHELEGIGPIITAARALDRMDSSHHPPNTMGDNKDNLNLIYKTLFVHPNRRRLDAKDGFPVRFGDIIALKPNAAAPRGSIFSGNADSVFLVATPACDLVRDPPAAKEALLVEGECLAIDAAAYDPRTPDTTIVIKRGNQKYGVKWKMKNLKTLTSTRLENLLAKDDVIIAGRLRTDHAAQLQQSMLSGTGRLGVMAAMPTNYPIKATILLPNAERTLVALPESLRGMCVVGRANNNKAARIGFDSSQLHDFADALREFEQTTHERSQEKLRGMLEPDRLNILFADGFQIDLTKAMGKGVELKLKTATDEEFKPGKVFYGVDATLSVTDPKALQSIGLVFEISEKLQA